MTVHAPIGQLIDQLYEARAARLECEKRVEELKATETAAKTLIMSQLQDTGLNSASGQFATVALRTKTIPVVTDWDKVYDFIHEQGMFELLHKRLTITLWSAMYEDGQVVPGTEPCEQLDLSITKSRRA